jgi:saccharopine dehydrogenase (NADP+, L-glutamate forming)/spermidine synthase
MVKILVLGAGLVTGPLVRYLLEQPDFHVKVASRTKSKAETLVGDHSNGEAEQLNVDNVDRLEELVSQADMAISLLPYIHHPTVAKLCIKHAKNMVTASYVSDAMRALDGEARDAGIMILNEIGVDPGIDHMSAMKIIHDVQNGGGRIASFYSYCGGLPAPEANTNPYGYKFSWSPKGVLLAAKNSAKYLKDRKEVNVSSEDLFDHFWHLDIPDLGKFEAYPNRNALPYMEIYGIQDTDAMYRGTLRYPGWCATLKKLVDLGILSEEDTPDIGEMTVSGFMGNMISADSSQDVRKALASQLAIDEDSKVMRRFEWLGLLDDSPVPIDKGGPIDVLVALMLKKMQYETGERDMLIQHHEFAAHYPDRKEKITSTLIDYGIPNGDTSMSRTVGLPCAVGARMVATGEIKETGVHIPVKPEIYKPVLSELENMGIVFKEKKMALDEA